MTNILRLHPLWDVLTMSDVQLEEVSFDGAAIMGAETEGTLSQFINGLNGSCTLDETLVVRHHHLGISEDAKQGVHLFGHYPGDPSRLRIFYGEYEHGVGRIGEGLVRLSPQGQGRALAFWLRLQTDWEPK
jgi:hypothetical protein